jgi:hypothetical protein
LVCLHYWGEANGTDVILATKYISLGSNMVLVLCDARSTEMRILSGELNE